MMRFSLFAAGIAALALGPSAAVAQTIVPGYHMEREYFHAGPAGLIESGREVLHAPDQDVPSLTGETHVPSNSVEGRGGQRLE